PDPSLAVSVTRLVPPWANSSRDSSSSASKSAPWSLPPARSSRSQSPVGCLPENGPPRPPNRASKKSLKPPRSPPTPSLVVHVHSRLRPPPGGGVKSIPSFHREPSWSYFFRVAGSPRTSWSSLISLNFSSATFFFDGVSRN